MPGDIVSLRIGDLVPADVRLLETAQLECDEAVLTGESMPAAKSARACRRGDSEVDLASCAFMGTIVHQGSARAVVVATGLGDGVRADRGRAWRAARPRRRFRSG